MASVLDAVRIESLEKPTVTIINEQFVSLFGAVARNEGLAALPFVVEQGVAGENHDPAGFAEAVLADVVRALTRIPATDWKG
jgi:hypothetical protein